MITGEQLEAIKEQLKAEHARQREELERKQAMELQALEILGPVLGDAVARAVKEQERKRDQNLLKLVENLVPELVEPITINSVQEMIRTHYPNLSDLHNLNPTTISGVLRKLSKREDGPIVLIKKGKGRRPSVYAPRFVQSKLDLAS